MTGRPEAQAIWSLRKFGWEKEFEIVIGMESQGDKGKPNPFPLELALSRFPANQEGAPEEGRIVAKECLYIGDTGDDMRAARAAGMWAVASRVFFVFSSVVFVSCFLFFVSCSVFFV